MDIYGTNTISSTYEEESEKCKNIQTLKVLALVKAKKKEHLTYLDRVDGQDQFETVVSKWKKSQNLSWMLATQFTWGMAQHVKTSGAPCLETSKKSMIIWQALDTTKIIDFTMNTL